MSLSLSLSARRAVIARTEREPAFRDMVMRAPKEAIATATGIRLDDGVAVTVLSDQPGHRHIWLPPSASDIGVPGDGGMAGIAVILDRDDPGFRAALKADPLGEMTSRLGIAAPAGLTLSVVEETAETLILILPPPAANDDELSDEVLDMVSGGGNSKMDNPEFYQTPDGTWKVRNAARP